MDSIVHVTHECSMEDVTPELKAILRAHMVQYHLTDLEPEILMCCETASTREKKGMFSRGVEKTQSAVFLTPKWLVWADSTDRNNAGAGSAELRNINVQDYSATAMYVIVPNEGINVTGRYSDVHKTGMTFIVLGSEPDGKKFRQMLQEAMKKEENH
jgi:hypothetical protein